MVLDLSGNGLGIGNPVMTEGRPFSVTLNPVVTAGPYTVGFIMGGLLKFLVGGPVLISTVRITCKSTTFSPTLHLFDRPLTNTTTSNNTILSIGAGDIAYLIRSIALIDLSASWVDVGTPNTIAIDGLGQVAIPVNKDQALYGLLQDGTGATLGSDSDITIMMAGVGA